MIYCCKGCKLRTEDCHAGCEKYQADLERHRKSKVWCAEENSKSYAMAEQCNGVNTPLKRKRYP